MSNNLLKRFKLFTDALSSGSGAAVWGTITGSISSQTDLQSALDTKLDENAPITGATKTKITYDSKGLVTSGADATTADIAASTDKNYVTDAELGVIQNTSGINTGDETKTTIVNKLDLISGSVSIDFGTPSNDMIITTVINPNVLSSTKFVCTVENDGTDHTGEDVYLENVIATVYNIVPNTSFDIIAVAHNLTWGRYKIIYKEII